MLLQGEIVAESPVYRGNARKTLFTRDDDGQDRRVSLAGEIGGTAKSLMDAFIGGTGDGRNIGLLNELWDRLYGEGMPYNLIKGVTCELQDASYASDHFFDLRMGLKLDEDRWASIANANYKMETVFRQAVFDFEMTVDDQALQENHNAARLYYMMEELRAGRFWFGAGKSKGLGRLRLKIDLDALEPNEPPHIDPAANHLQMNLTFSATNPVLVGWNWGKVDPEIPSFTAVEGRLLIAAMRDLPTEVQERLQGVLGGPILTPDDWKRKLAEYLPRTIAIWLQEGSAEEREVWTLAESALKKLRKGRYPIAKQVVEAAQPLCGQPFPSKEAAEAAFEKALGDKANMAGRLVNEMESERMTRHEIQEDVWAELAGGLGFDEPLQEDLTGLLDDEAALTKRLTRACEAVLPRLYQQVNQQIDLLQSDTWVDEEIKSRGEHLQIKVMLLKGEIDEHQWKSSSPPEGVSTRAWQTFRDEHRRVRYRYMTHPRNLRKSIVNDRNFIAFLQGYRSKARQELAQPYNVDFRGGGPFNRQINRKYGKPYDTVFMRMLSWAPSNTRDGGWEIYIPGSTIKGAFRRRASQVLKTYLGEGGGTEAMIKRLFGAQGQIGLVYFSDAYLTDPHDPNTAWCSMDGVRMNPSTGQPIENAKSDYLFAYGNDLVFQVRLDLQDITDRDLPAVALLFHLLEDFRRGDIVIGGEKTSGFGWVEAEMQKLTWLTGNRADVTDVLFPERELRRDGLWWRLDLGGEGVTETLPSLPSLPLRQSVQQPPVAREGFISHRAFGGNCGMLVVEAEALTPLHIRESGEPSWQVTLSKGQVNGWDAFSMSPPEAAMRPEDRTYALPSKSVKGMIRHIYTIASDSQQPSVDLSRLNPADALFGWVGKGTDQSVMGRLAFSFAMFEEAELAWFKAPYPYTGWRFNPTKGEWVVHEDQAVSKYKIADTWRVFRHKPLAPLVKQLDDFTPDDVQASYFRALLPGAKAKFTIRFWNLEDEELQRLMWSVHLQPGLAHKIGHRRYLGFGSLKLRVLPESYFIDWSQRYANVPDEEWQRPIDVASWINPEVIAHYVGLMKALDVGAL
ncbi:MAG: RAMP superfamily CRISPR-associated protein [Anaerolineales bacterium]